MTRRHDAGKQRRDDPKAHNREQQKAAIFGHMHILFRGLTSS
jgi:hypothetical protein